MKRHPALQDLSRDHHMALIHAREIHRILNRHSHAQPLDLVTENFLTFWDQEGNLHFLEEEQILIPLFQERDPTARPLITRVLEDHRWLRENIEKLRDLTQSEGAYLRLLESIGQRLHDHVRFEERVLFQQIQEVLTGAELDDLGARSRAYRLEMRGAGAIGPNRRG